MSFNTCPMATVNAPIDQVWRLLSDPASYALWWDAETRSIVPKGLARPGQKIFAKTRGLGKQWNARIIVESVDPAKHQIDLKTMLPFGITVSNHIVCTPIDQATRVTFG